MPSTSEGGKKTRKTKRAPATIGWREWAAFPALGAERIKAKIDSGAKTSAIHAFKVKVVRRADGEWAEFRLHPLQKSKTPEIKCAAPIVDRRRIRSSNGAVEERIIIRTMLRLGAREWPIELSLAKRDEMGFRLLLGRSAIRRRFVIDPGASFLLGK
ncbi:MAG: ATP-dependent zinc protease [Alphaproteobacteria bacterium]|nr:ATP-dependent zinc protease [Alphaproteobacteria bacterium]